MGYVLISSGSNYNFAVGNNTYVTTEVEEVVDHLRKALDEKMGDNIYTRGNYKLKASPIRVLDALKTIGFNVVSSGGADGRFIWTVMKTVDTGPPCPTIDLNSYSPDSLCNT
ncbi:hypothetical protein HDE_08284 [Halotydeus destructor]|nr:hypothetical protein HDE_08284 [Halotydeus destructor]